MNDPEYLRGHCDQCRGEIEFPATAAGQMTACPLCGQSTGLVAAPVTPAAAVRPAKRGVSSGVVLALVGAVAIAVAGVTLLRRGPTSEETIAAPSTVNTNASTAPATASTRTAPAIETNSAPASPTKPRSLDDLITGPISLEKAKNSSLVYAVGVLRNESDHQRFGVTVEVELTDARGNDAGTAKDYRAVIEPRQEWRFRALVLNSKATSGSVTRIREE